VELERSVNHVWLPLLEEMELLPVGAQVVDDPSLGQRTTHQIEH